MLHSLRQFISTDTKVRRPAVILIGVSLLVLLLAPRWISIFTESINWDEFAMLERTDRTLRHGEILGAGRPGLVTILLTHFVRDCTDAITTAVRARVFWQFITLMYLAGVFVVVRGWFHFSRRPEHGLFEGAAAVALLAFLPSFVAWSVQVRSDQAALAAAVWGGAAILSDRRWLDPVAGVLIGLALLCSQKAVYPAALCGLLWVTAVAARLEHKQSGEWKFELVTRVSQVVVVVISIGATLLIYGLLVPKAVTLVDGLHVVSAWDQMRVVRERIGYRTYFAELARAPVHAFLIFVLLISSAASLAPRQRRDLHLLVTSWSVMLLGLAVIVVHGSGYPYFLMTAGLFPAVSIGLASGHLSKHLAKGRTGIVSLLVFALFLGSVPITAEILNGHQQDQRDTIAWIKSSGIGAYDGYQADGALICMTNHDQIPPLSHTLNMRSLYEPAVIDGLIDNLLGEFRDRPVAYVIDADGLAQFPIAVKKFFADHYVWYYGSVWVPGFEIVQVAAQHSVDVIVPSTYRWIPTGRTSSARLIIAGQEVGPRDSIQLEAGMYMVAIEPSGARGTLVMDVASPSGVDRYSFVDPRQVRRLYSLE